MYVFGPLINDGIKKFVTYQIGGSSMSSEVTRRYSDFFALREKLLERWPGVYIPNIPPKKVVGNTDLKTIEKRVRMLNAFCYKLSTLSYLFSSEEVNVFQTANGEISKIILALPKMTPEDIRNKYQQSFTDYYDGYDITLGLNRLSDFGNYLKLYQTNLNNFKESVIKYLEKKTVETSRYLELIHNFEEHERCTLIEYVENKDENKLVFANPRNSELNERVRNLRESLINPYNSLLDWIEEEEIDIEAMLEAMNSLKGLESIKNKLRQKLDTLNNQLEGFRSSGKKTFTMIFKKPDEVANEMEKEKINTEANIQSYEDIIKMASFNMEWYIERFKKEKSYEYFRHLKIFAKTQTTNTAVLDNLWKNVKNNMAEHTETSE